MNRLFGSKPAVVKPTLNGAIASSESRVDKLEIKIAQYNAQLSELQRKMSRMVEGPGKRALRGRAAQILRQRKMYEAQRDQIQAQMWSMEQTSVLQDNLVNTLTTVEAMQTSTRSLEKQYRKLNVDKIDRLNDKLTDLMEVSNSVQEAMTSSYGLPEEIDEADLDAELEAMAMEREGELSTMTMMDDTVDGGGIPAYLMDGSGSMAASNLTPPKFIDEAPTRYTANEAGEVRENEALERETAN